MGSKVPSEPAGWVVQIDEDLCIGAGECVAAAPGAFALDDADLVARVLPAAAHTTFDELSAAASDCPTGAISIREAG